MMVIALLESSPKNGVEVMDGIEAMTRGWWRPSPGSVYPLLDQMAQEGLLRKAESGRYELTAKAKVELEVSFGPRFRKPRTVTDVVDEINWLLSYLEDVVRTGSRELDPHRARVRDFSKRLSELEGNASDAKESP
ncbi:MAG: helix-turn-helix transcriptional regulator [Thaumarchaeota archaeon]|nr:helix-turn-helix transcriptional regulator [Nitrososphaerota archaeon]